MKTLAFLSQKGGSGKTTLAVHAAVAARERGRRVLLLDTDPQRSAAGWRDARAEQTGQPGDALFVRASSVANLGRIMAEAEAQGVEVLMVDTAPRADTDTTLVARRADLVLIPCRPTAFDLKAVSAAMAIVTKAHARAAFVLSDCTARAREIEEVRHALADYGFPVAPGEITRRMAFARAVSTGQAVTEFDPKSRAADEIRGLWNWLEETMR